MPRQSVLPKFAADGRNDAGRRADVPPGVAILSAVPAAAATRPLDRASADCREASDRMPLAPSTAAPSTAGAESVSSRRPVPLLKTIVFLGGFASIGIELAASRLIAPYFGSSTFIWATLIGLTLTFLSLGYWLGGRVADRHPSPVLLYTVTAVGAAAAGVVPLLARPILATSLAAFSRYDIGAFYGALLGTLALLALPITLLGFISPFAIRLAIGDVASAGNTAGTLYALSTIGSIAGSFLPVLLLIPLAGTTITFLVLSLALLIPSLVGLLILRARGPAGGAVALAFAVPALALGTAGGAIRPAEVGTLLTERESTYNYIQVVRDGAGRNLLILNEGHAVHSIYDPKQLLTGGPWDYAMVAPLVVDGAGPGTVRDGMLIGLAGGTMARQLSQAYGPIPIEGVEIDPEIAAVGREYFGLDDLPNVDVVVQDGRYALRTSNQRYDFIGVDAYRQPYIPFQLTTREFFQDVADHLSPTGVAMVNAGRTTTDYRLVDVVASTMRSVFAHVYVIDVEGYTNSIVIGTNSPSSIANIATNAARFPADSPARTVAGWSEKDGRMREIAPGGVVYTDDHAPVEWLVDEIIVDAALQLSGH
jgi:spermidine synthase